MAPLLVLTLGVLALVVLPRSLRPAVVIAFVTLESALVARALTDDPGLVIGGAIVAALTALLVREITGTFRLLAEPTSRAGRERRRTQGELTVDERELRRRTREKHRERDRRAA